MLYIVRGLPGAGKSTIAKKLCDYVVEADMYFMKDGEYQFDPSKLKSAHGWCQAETKRLLKNGLDVAVANTFTQMWEMKPYLKMAEELDVPYQIIEVKSNFKNVHGVPEEAINRMKNRWEVI